jgi:mono/diheme cytochrome c family protein
MDASTANRDVTACPAPPIALPGGMRSVVALVVLLVVANAARAAEADLGTKLYAERCSGCHGDDGKGDGPAAAALVPKPRNFRDTAFWQDRKAEDLKVVVHKGKVGTMMPPFAGVLTDAEIDAVVAHVETFAPARPAPR